MKTIKQQLPLSLCSMVLLVLMLLLGAKAQILECSSHRNPDDDCTNNQSVFASYDAEQCIGFKVLDGVKAQEEFVREKVRFFCPRVYYLFAKMCMFINMYIN